MKWTTEDISPAQTEHATSLRIPFLSSSSPRWCYITGIVVGETWVDKGLEPTDAEVSEVAEWLEDYNRYWYREGYRTKMADFAPYDIDGGANLGYLMKRAEDSWCYRKRTWTHGVYWWPARDETMPLTAVLDKCRPLKGGGVVTTAPPQALICDRCGRTDETVEWPAASLCFRCDVKRPG